MSIKRLPVLFLSLLVQSSYIISSQSNNQFAWNGDKYDKNSSLQYRIGIEAIESFNLRGNENVLDIGCGNGKITALCAGKLKSGSVTAIDLSSSMIEFAHKNYGDRKNVAFLLCDVTAMAYDQEFDFVYSLFCLHWVKDQEIAMKNIAKSLKPGGKAVLYISLPNEFNQIFKDELNKLINSEAWKHYKDVLNYNHFPIPKETWFNYAKQNSLKISFKIMQDSVVYENYDAFKQRLTAYGVGAEILQVMGQEQGNYFVDCLLENFYSALGLVINQPIAWKTDSLIFTLTKLKI